MNMLKNKLHRLPYCLMAIAALTLSAGCSKDDPVEDVDEINVVAYASYTVKLDYPADELALFDITAEYTSTTGGMTTETINGAWSKTIDFRTFPADFSLTVRLKLKEGVELTKDHYELGCNQSRKMIVHYADGSTDSGDSMSSNGSLSVAADKIAQYAEKHSEDVKIAFTVDLNADRSNVVRTDK